MNLETKISKVLDLNEERETYLAEIEVRKEHIERISRYIASDVDKSEIKYGKKLIKNEKRLIRLAEEMLDEVIDELNGLLR